MAEGDKLENIHSSAAVAQTDEPGDIQNYISSIVLAIINAATKSETVILSKPTSSQPSAMKVEKETIPDGKTSSDRQIKKDQSGTEEIDITNYITDAISTLIEKATKSKDIVLRTSSTDELIEKELSETSDIREYIARVILNLINKATKSVDTSSTTKELTQKGDIRRYIFLLVSRLIEKVIKSDHALLSPSEIIETDGIEEYILAITSNMVDAATRRSIPSDESIQEKKPSHSTIDTITKAYSISKMTFSDNLFKKSKRKRSLTLNQKILEYSQSFADEFDTCNQYLDIVSFAQKFVDGIIQKAQQFVQKQTQTAKFNYIYPKAMKELVLPIYKQSRDYVVIEYDRPKFRGWPTIEQFTVKLGAEKINKYLSSFNLKEEWIYVICYLNSRTESCSTLYKYEVIWSLPTNQYPIVQATATMFFTIEVSKAMPPYCPVHVTFNFEGYRHLHTPSIADFNEDWLNQILDQKISIFKTVTF